VSSNRLYKAALKEFLEPIWYTSQNRDSVEHANRVRAASLGLRASFAHARLVCVLHA
jgi:hypothetical protein